MHERASLDEASRPLCMAASSEATESLILIKLCVLLSRVLMELTSLETARLKVGQKICIISITLSLSVNGL